MGAAYVIAIPHPPREAFDGRFRRACQNIAHYVEQLKTEIDPIKRAMPQTLLAEEKAKLAKPR